MDTLKERQAAGERVEKDMLDFLIQYAPARHLTIEDATAIARYARTLSFTLFSEAVGEWGER